MSTNSDAMCLKTGLALTRSWIALSEDFAYIQVQKNVHRRIELGDH
jgi:hypothetical protein